MTIQERCLLKYNSLEELLDDITTEKSTGIKRVFSEIGSDKNGYSDFKRRLVFFKEILERDLPSLTKEEIIKFDRYFHTFREIYKWSGYDFLLKAMHWEILKTNRI